MDYYHQSKFFGSLEDWVVALSQKLGLVASHREFVVVALLRAAGVAEALVTGLHQGTHAELANLT
jgi:hypothetical protein